MSEHSVVLEWKRSSEDFTIKTYNRDHQWTFEGGQSVSASAAPDYKGDPKCVNPEEAFVASLASCHMLTFLALASMKGFSIDSYDDEPRGILAKNESGKMAMTHVILKPKIVFTDGQAPSEDELSALHDKAHKECFIANSVNTTIEVQ